MKRNKLVIGSLSTVAIALTAVFLSSGSSNEAPNYESKGLEALTATSNPDDANAWWDARFIDLETGEKITPEKLALLRKQNNSVAKSTLIEWTEEGPDNIGGRTRAVCASRVTQGTVWAGSTTGGLFKSVNTANHWYEVLNFPGSKNIAAIAEAPNGVVVVATGSTVEGPNGTIGDGIYYTTDDGDTWTLITGTASLGTARMTGTTNNNNIWMSTSQGLKVWDAGALGATSEPASIASNTSSTSVSVSGDGMVIAATAGTSLVVSTDGGQSFSVKSGSGAGQAPNPSGTRREVAVSWTKNSSGNHQIYGFYTSISLINKYFVSTDNGNTWETQLSNITNNDDTQTLNILRSQGSHNTVLYVDPTDATQAFLGGIDIWSWKQVASSPISGGYTKKSLWYVAPQSSIYVHADNHTITHDANNTMYFANDGGIGVSTDQGETFYPANRGYNVVQYYGMAFDRNGSVLGGAQDNGTTYNDHTNSTWKEFVEVTGGDGFECEISFYNPNILFTTVQFNSLNRSSDGGASASSFGPNIPGSYNPLGESGTNPFHSEIFMAEYLDYDSKDSVLFIPTQDFTAGDLVQVPSLASGDTIEYITPIDLSFDDTVHYESSLTTTDYIVTDTVGPDVSYDLGIYNYTGFVTASNPPVPGDTLEVNGPQGLDTIVVITVTPYTHYYGQNASTSEIVDLRMDTLKTNVAWDTLNVQDPFQSWFFLYIAANGGELWGTRDALRLATANPKWSRVVEGIGGLGEGSIDVEFSEDLNHIFIATSSGGIKRVDGLADIYSTEDDFYNRTSLEGTSTEQTVTNITSASFEGIGIDPRNPDELVAVQGFSGSVFRSSNATDASPTLTNVGSQGGIAFYDVIMDRDDNDLLVAGTAFGVQVSSNGGATWEDCSTGFGQIPVLEVRQSWRTWDEGNFKPGAIYIATYGRGIWSSESVASLTDNGSTEDIKDFTPNMNIFPNPMADNGTISFEMATTGNVNINVYSLSGQLVKTIQRTNVAEGQNNIQFNTSDLPRGTYIVKLQGGTSKDTAKFIKM